MTFLRLNRRWPLAVGGLIAAGGLLAILLIGGGRAAKEDQTWEQALSSGTLRVGMDAAYPPFEYVNEQNEIVGFDVDFAREIGRRLGFEIAFVNMAYDGLYDSLLIGQVDLLISALVAAPQFEGKALFTEPYFNAGEFLVVPEGSAIATMEDLHKTALAVEYGSGGDVEARVWERRLEDMAVSRYPDPDSALQAVLNGEADAALVDGISARLGVGAHPELALADNVVDNLFAVAVNPDSRTLYKRVSATVAEMIGDGTVDALIDEWFGPQEQAGD